MLKRDLMILFACFAVVAVAGCDDEEKVENRPFPERFKRYTVSDTAYGAAFAVVEDVDGDGHDDIVVSNYGEDIRKEPGFGSIFKGSGDLDNWEEETYFGTDEGLQFPTHPNVADLDQDGDMDILLQGGFFLCIDCGFVAWFEQDGDAWVRHDVVQNGNKYWFHGAELADMNEDGILDMVTTAEQWDAEGKSENPQIYLGNDGPDRFETTPLELGIGLGSMPDVYDVDGDGDLDIASAEFFLPAEFLPFSFAWFEQTAPISAENPAGLWERNIIADDVGPAIMLKMVPDLYGDGKLYAVGSVHTNVNEGDPWESAVYSLEIVKGSETEPWPQQKLSQGIESRPGQGQMAPGVFGWGDVDGDGDIDIAVSGDGDERIFVLEQTETGDFLTHTLAEGMGQAGGMEIVDMDEDGNAEIVMTVYEQNAVYIYEYKPL